MAQFGLFVGEKLLCTADDALLLLTYAPEDTRWRIVRREDEVTLMQPVDGERVMYRMTAWVAKSPEGVTAVDVSMEFNLSLGTAIKMLAQLETAGLISSRLEVVGGYKQVRRYAA